MSDINQLSLFGIDLSVALARLRLGVDQLLQGKEAGLFAALAPRITVVGADPVGEVNPDSTIADDGEFSLQSLRALLMSDDMTLCKEMDLPAAAEAFLDEAMLSHLQLLSPFDAMDTAWGIKILEREPETLRLAVAIVSKAAVQAHIDKEIPSSSSRAALPEVWAPHPSGPILIRGFGEAARLNAYYRRLGRIALRFSVSVTGILLLAAMPGFFLAERAAQFDTALAEVAARAGTAVGAKNQLVAAQERLDIASAWLNDYSQYGPWLHKIAEVTPDSVYLNRLSLSESELTISGLAENAADYQRVLSDSGLFKDVRAPSAFNRDKRANRERFTLTMTLVGEPTS